ncbi:MAG: cytochrome b N-terminal domain-containing protein [Frankiaceae bacterium]
MSATDDVRPTGDAADDTDRMWTARLRGAAVRSLPPERLLPDRQPEYVASWIYVFGVAGIAALIVVLVSGGVLAVQGPSWWHRSSVGLFVNSVHLWSTELFFFVMVIHLWGKFFMAAWRGRRRLTWVTGAIAFIAAVMTAFTGYLVQQNFDSEWISTQAKDGLNSVGIGAWFNVLDFGQMLMWHITLAPLALIVLTVWHVLQVRRRGVVPPLPPPRRGGTPRPAAAADAPTPAAQAPPAGEGTGEASGGAQ